MKQQLELKGKKMTRIAMKKKETKADPTASIHIKSTDMIEIVYYAFRYSVERNTMAGGIVSRSIAKNWKSFEKFEQDNYLKFVQDAVVRGKIRTMKHWLVWRPLFKKHEAVTDSTIQALESIVVAKEKGIRYG